MAMDYVWGLLAGGKMSSGSEDLITLLQHKNASLLPKADSLAAFGSVAI
jgi:hypothetical protein